jgi:hypothetical protein
VELRSPPASTEDPMTDDRMALVELLRKSGDPDFLRAVAEAVLQLLMETDVAGLIGAARHERSPTGQARGLKAHERLNTATVIVTVPSRRGLDP